jgi:hypothetical protein
MRLPAHVAGDPAPACWLGSGLAGVAMPVLATEARPTGRCRWPLGRRSGRPRRASSPRPGAFAVRAAVCRARGGRRRSKCLSLRSAAGPHRFPAARDPASPLPPAKRVLIPLGRSLQRTAAAPDYFAYPRVVVAVDSPPPLAGVPLLKDRLYIGYQEQSAVSRSSATTRPPGASSSSWSRITGPAASRRWSTPTAASVLPATRTARRFSRARCGTKPTPMPIAATLLASGRRFYGIPPTAASTFPTPSTMPVSAPTALP